MSESRLSLDEAQQVLTDYGKVLSSLQPSIYGLPQSLLPHSKDRIKAAIRLLLAEVDIEDPQIRNSLIESYVFLAYFVSDTDAALVSDTTSLLNSQAPEQIDLETSVTGNRLVNSIKLEMERLLQEIELFQNTRQYQNPSS